MARLGQDFWLSSMSGFPVAQGGSVGTPEVTANLLLLLPY